MATANGPRALGAEADDLDSGDRTPAGLVVGTTPTGPADYRDADETYAAGDCVGFIAKAGTPAPADVSTPLTYDAGYRCLGYLDTSGYIFKLDETTKDIGASGTLSSIRTVITGGVKTLQATYLQAMNPFVRSLFDDVDPSLVFPQVARVDATCGTTSASAVVTDTGALASDLNKPVTGTGVPANAYVLAVNPGVGFTLSAPATATGSGVSLTIGANTGTKAQWILPEVPGVNQYTFCFDTVDGDKKIRLFCPLGKVTARGNDQPQQADINSLDMTLTMYPADILVGPANGPVQRGTVKRYADYGASIDLTKYPALA